MAYPKIKRMDMPAAHADMDYLSDEEQCYFASRVMADASFHAVGLKMLVDSLPAGWYKISEPGMKTFCFVKKGTLCFEENVAQFDYEMEQLLVPVLRASEIVSLKTLYKAGLTSQEQNRLLRVHGERLQLRDIRWSARKGLSRD